MFIEALKRQNPKLISAAIALWQQGKIAPDSWVIDVDRVIENGKRLLDVARQHGISLYLMTKQVGRNPWLADKLLQLGYEGIVVVDYKESRVMRRAGLPVAHRDIWCRSRRDWSMTQWRRAPRSSRCSRWRKRVKFQLQR